MTCFVPLSPASDSLLISIMDLVTSIIAGFVVFTTFGGMAKKIGSTVEDVAKGGRWLDQFKLTSWGQNRRRNTSVK